MTLTGLEATLLAVVLGLVVGLVTNMVSRNNCVSRRECRERHDLASKGVEGIKYDVRMLFRMIRSLVIHSNIPKEEQDNILNSKGGE